MKHKLEAIFALHNINNISCDSRRLENICAFFAIKGNQYNGNDYINIALANGAKIAFTDQIALANESNIYYLEDARLGFALAASILYPDHPRYMMAVTGTNGKSSVVSYIRQILSLLGKNSCSIGTLGIESDRPLNIDNSSPLTTGDALFIRKTLNHLYRNNIDYVALEASSHGLDQHRMGDLKFNSVAFVSFSQDHLDYHNDIDSYFNAKMKLFYNHLSQGGEAVINADLKEYPKIKELLTRNNIKHSAIGLSGDIQIKSIRESIKNQKISYLYNEVQYNFTTEILGSFQVYNILIAAKLVSNMGINITAINPILHKLQAVAGRLQRVNEAHSDHHIFVDYAHTPEALEKSLLELKKLLQNNGKLIVIFGCGGDRDRAKRPIMGHIASQIADIVVITDDNPRTENSSNIIAEIMIGAPKALIIQDRKDAITQIIESLAKDDILLIAGKGHENYQIIGTEKLPFSDIEIAKQIINYAQKNLDK